MFLELKGELQAIRKEVKSIKEASDVDEIQSLCSSLDSNTSHIHVSPFIQQQQPALLSPPAAAATAPMFRPRANSLPPIYMEPYVDALTLPAAASKAQQMRNDLQLLPQQSTASHQQPFPPTMSGGALISAPIAGPSGVGLSSPPLMSPPPYSQPSYTLVPSVRAIPVRPPLPIPDYMPLKTAESIIKKHPQFLNDENIGRLAAKLARFTYFGETVLAHSSISGGADKNPLNPTILMEMKRVLRNQFPTESPTEFETKWAKCADSINRVCKYVYSKK